MNWYDFRLEYLPVGREGASFSTAEWYCGWGRIGADRPGRPLFRRCGTISISVGWPFEWPDAVRAASIVCQCLWVAIRRKVRPLPVTSTGRRHPISLLNQLLFKKATKWPPHPLNRERALSTNAQFSSKKVQTWTKSFEMQQIPKWTSK